MWTETERKFSGRAIATWLVGLNPDDFAAVESAALGKSAQHGRMFLTLEQALDARHPLQEKQNASRSSYGELRGVGTEGSGDLGPATPARRNVQTTVQPR